MQKSMRSGLQFRDLPPWPAHEFATAIRANALHLFRAIFAKSAFVRANVRFVAGR
jgi:hypothetical protein